MMTNLFSIFDPSTTLFNLSLNWFSSILGLLFVPFLYWFSPNRYSWLWFTMINKLHLEFKTLLKTNKSGLTLMMITLFTMIMMNNFLGLFPYIFTSTSHLSMTLSIALPLWISFMLYGWIINYNHMFIHLVPQGTPSILMPFMVCIETISNIIRPLTLAVRLTANMIAGHLLLTLLGNTGPMMNLITINGLISVQFALLLLESAVAIIQAYVFAILITLYSSETY
uniref:ATP synthase F0 subunit 6 n=1 Tax=Semidalis macleodi TaxID=2919411 RepID=UPI001FA6D89D|nr:ATP synthase F0 subunit 6 [Semidalis macleodi]ULR86826.1 ATP synthase F0 subunit 6 [Semidalis macleodi]